MSEEEAKAVVTLLRDLHVRINMLQALGNRVVNSDDIKHHWNDTAEDIEECKATLRRLWP